MNEVKSIRTPNFGQRVWAGMMRECYVEKIEQENQKCEKWNKIRAR